MRFCGSGATMINGKIAIDDLRRLVYKYVHDYEIVDLMEDYLQEIEESIKDPSPQIEVELENILDVCAGSDDYGKILGSVNRVKDMVYGE